MRTFKDLLEFLRNSNFNNIQQWINDENDVWEGKEKQESILRLFAQLNLIYKLKDFQTCQGNFNKQTITPNIPQTNQQFFYNNENSETFLNDTGDLSDLTLYNKNNPNEILVISSKNKNKLQINGLGVLELNSSIQQYINTDFQINIGLCVPDNIQLQKLVKRARQSSKNVINIIKNALVIDQEDLNQAYKLFLKEYKNKTFDDVIQMTNNTILQYKLHQKVGALKIIKFKQQNIKSILAGQIQRSGKSYFMRLGIHLDSENKKKCNYLILTTSPNETIIQYNEALNPLKQFDFNIITLSGKNKNNIQLRDKNIIICSKQFLQTKIENQDTEKTTTINWLKDLTFDLRFIDESHNGGTTELTKTTLQHYGKDSTTIFMTATYIKPINVYNIQKEHQILWDIEDIKLCQNIHIQENKQKLIQKHGDIMEDILNEYTDQQILNDYIDYPSIHVLTEKINQDFVDQVLKDTNTDYGYSMESILLLNEDNKTFQNQQQVSDLIYRIFGKRNNIGIPDSKYPDEEVYMDRIKQLCQTKEISQKTINDIKVINEPQVIMCFLPRNNINNVSQALKQYIMDNNLLKDYEIVITNSNTTSNPKQVIDDAVIRVNNHQTKHSVLVLTYTQCGLGVSIDLCDVVILLNNLTSFDMLFQMMFRCMTPRKGKKAGFVIDLNIRRQINVALSYAQCIVPNKHPSEQIKYLLNQKLININSDQFIYNKTTNFYNSFVNNIYKIFQRDFENQVQNNLKRLKGFNLDLLKEQQDTINNLFKYVSKENIQKDKQILQSDQSQIQEGIQKIQIIDQNGASSSGSKEESDFEEDQDNNKQINFMDIIIHIIPFVCILTISDEKTDFESMINYIFEDNDQQLIELLVSYCKAKWNKDINVDILKDLIQLYILKMKDNIEQQDIIRTIKELFIRSLNDMELLSKNIDKYLIPSLNEKQKNAEVSTPYQLRQDMIQQLDNGFWSKPRKVFEPCSGKGGFLIDIYNRLYKGLKELYPDEKERKRVILEECIYFSEFNETNIFICKLLLDPKNEYKLNYNQGDTLLLNIKDKWKSIKDNDGFDLIIGNPPYQNQQRAINRVGGYGGKTLWDKFVLQSLNQQLIQGGFLVFVHPSSWRKPSHYLYQTFQENNLINLKIFSKRQGQQLFNCSVRVDYYLLQKCQYNNKTIIMAQDNISYKLNISQWQFIPNGMYHVMKKIFSFNKINTFNVIYSSSIYDQRKQNMSLQKDQNFNLQCIHNMTKKGLGYRYSNENKGHFGIKKVILSHGEFQYPVNDYKGQYGMTPIIFGLQINNKKEGENIINAINSQQFKDILVMTKWSIFQTEWRMFNYLKKDFWQYFLN